MSPAPDHEPVDSLILRFRGTDDGGSDLHELRAAHVAEVLQGVVGLASDFSKSGAFGDGPGSEVYVRPAEEGSFLVEVFRHVTSDPAGTATALAAGAGAMGLPTLGQVLKYATKSARADVADITYLDNGNVKISWQDNTVDEVSKPVWDELKVRKRRRRKQLRQLMTPLSDERVEELEVSDVPTPVLDEEVDPTTFTLRRPDYNAVRPEEEIEEAFDIFEAEAQMTAVDFDNPQRWRVKAKGENRTATVQDEDFLGRVSGGFAIRKNDIFRLRIREDVLVKDGRTTRKWTVLEVVSHRRAAHDDDA